jgi:rod shape-determining protein MreC
MESFLSRYKNALVLIAVVLAQAIALAVQVQRPKDAVGPHGPDGKYTSTLRYWTVALITPFEKVVHGTSLDMRGVWTGYIGLRHAHQQDQALQQEVVRLRIEQASLAEDAAQDRRLQALLQFKQQYISKTVAAQVIGTSGSDSSQLLYIDKGSADGLKNDQPVITPDGVVGKLRDVFPHTAQLLLLNDPTAGAGVVLDVSRIRGILRGTANGKIEIDNLTADNRIKVGDKVVTSGGDMVFPRGLPVGVIQSIQSDPRRAPFLTIVVKPFVDMQRLEEVLVITGTQATLSPAAQQDANAADATAQQSQKAADIIADRLPSVNTTPAAEATTDDIGGVPGVPYSGMPAARTPLHPDKYSPDAAPPAADMAPGGGKAPE